MEFSEWKKQNGGQDKKENGNGNRNNNRNASGYRNGNNNRNASGYRNGNNNRNTNGYRNGNNDRYVGAPYNFVPFYDKVYEYPQDKLTAHNAMEEELVTGEITYEIKAQTPIFIDDGKGDFFKDAEGRYAIPGSSIRGLIRSNVQVLGLCGYDDDIDDYSLMYRNVAGGAEKRQYNTTLGSKQITINDGNKSYGIGVLLNVRAGYIENRGGKYVIHQTAVDAIRKEFKEMNYYVLSERKVVNDFLKYGNKFSYGFFRQNGRSILQHEFEEFERSEDRNNRVHYKGTPNRKYVPYYKPISYKIARLKDVVAVGHPGEYENEGYAVSTGKMNEKKAIYIIPKIDKEKPCISIPEKDVRAFQIDLKKKENTLKQFGGREYFDLPKEDEMRPVFYIRLNGRLYFGFTPRLRLFYDHMLKEGLKQKAEKGHIDYCKAMFGYAESDQSYRSKLSFSDALLQGDVSQGNKKSIILAEPKPTSYLDYLMQDQKNPVTYNTDDFRLRGAKQYWLHHSLVPTEDKSGKAASVINPLKEGARFVGKIRFQNLTQDELGLLLWAVRLNKDSQMNIGKAKAYGYGRIAVHILEARQLDMKKAYSSVGKLELDPFCEIDQAKAIESYKTEIGNYLKKPIDQLPHIKDFFLMKDSGNIPSDAKTRYMKIDAREYQNRSKPLPTVKDIVKTQ